MRKDMIGDVPGNVLGMLADLLHKLQHGKILPEELAKFLQRKSPFGSEISDMMQWQRFYQKVFGMKLNFSEIVLPVKQAGFNWLVIMAEGLTPNRLFDKCQERFAS